MNKLNPFPVTATLDEIKSTTRIIPKLHFEKNINDKKMQVEDIHIIKKGSDILVCKICGRTYTRYNKQKHDKTKIHILCVNMNKKWRDMILDK